MSATARRKALALARKRVVDAAKTWKRANDPFVVPMSEIVTARQRLADAVSAVEHLERA